ncbi:Rgg family transcriptional regulator [Carnobacterium divergens]|uniref:Rgg family transcriptional regulator n=1 Tax=Carnobacterium divergens TaxID=2748 RepID=UPI0007F3A013|nr:hypothetical protein [Carnobacterium divergens]SBO16634.1 putative transcriptional activator, Rgg/GadR/Mut family [Carnobacterium divergens]
MEMHEAVALIRKNKNIPVKKLTNDIISRATYNRFISGQTDLNICSFLSLIENLHISLDELTYIKNGYTLNIEQDIMNDIKKAFEIQNLDELHALQKFCAIKASCGEEIFAHLEGLIDLLLARVTGKSVSLIDNSLYEYLIKVETWTRYELILFNNSLFLFDIDSTKIILSRAVHSLDQLSELQPYGNESFRLVTNAIVFFLQHESLFDADKYIQYLSRYQLPEDYLYERLLLKIFTNIQSLLILNQKDSLEEIYKCLDFFDYLGSPSLKKMMYDLIQDILKIYKP